MQTKPKRGQPLKANKLDAVIIARVNKQMKAEYINLGGTVWLRDVLTKLVNKG